MRTLTAALLGLLLAAASTQAQTVSAAYEGIAAASTTVTIANVDANGSGLIVAVAFRQNSAQTITGVTHGATNLTACAALSVEGPGVGTQYWYSTSASGSQTVTATMSASADPHMYAVVLTGSHATNPCSGTQVGGGVTGTALSATVTSTGLVLSTIFVRAQVAASLAPDAGQTELHEQQDGNFTSGISSEGGSGSIASGYTWTGSFIGAILNMPIAAAAGGGGGSAARNCPLLGVCE